MQVQSPEHLQRVVVRELGVPVGIALGFAVVGMAYAVVKFPDRVHVMQDLAQALGTGVAGDVGQIG